MPRGPRLDYFGALHHVMFRGIERREIFLDDTDRNRLLARLSRLIPETNAAVYAWAFMPNHVHLLVRPGPSGLSKLMQRLVGWHAASFNRRHQRHGHLTQNRFKSILVEEDAYFIELVRYLHLNPVRAGLVRSIDQLDDYPWTGHSRLMGAFVAPWQDVDFVLAGFGHAVGCARRAYRDFVVAGWTQGPRSDLQGGGLRRARGCWRWVDNLPRGREADTCDERILGGPEFVQRVLTLMNAAHRAKTLPMAFDRPTDLRTLVERGARLWHQRPDTITSSCKKRAAADARAAICFLAVERLGLGLAEVADQLGISRISVWRGVQRGRVLLARSAGIEPELLALASSRPPPIS